MDILDILRKHQAKTRKSPSNEEHDIQVACVNWFRYAHPHLAMNLFAVPNGGRRDRVTGAKLKAEGVVAGVADLLLLWPNTTHHGLCIEMKRPKGVQSDSQKMWQKVVEDSGYRYVVCHSVAEFEKEIKIYLG